MLNVQKDVEEMILVLGGRNGYPMFKVDLKLQAAISSGTTGFCSEFGRTRLEDLSEAEGNLLKSLWTHETCRGNLRELEFKWSCRYCYGVPQWRTPGLLKPRECPQQKFFCYSCLPLFQGANCPEGCGHIFDKQDLFLIPFPFQVRKKLMIADQSEKRITNKDTRRARRKQRQHNMINITTTKMRKAIQNEDKISVLQKRVTLLTKRKFRKIEKMRQVLGAKIRQKAYEWLQRKRLQAEVEAVLLHFKKTTTIGPDSLSSCRVCKKKLKNARETKRHKNTAHRSSSYLKSFRCARPRCTYETTEYAHFKRHWRPFYASVENRQCPLLSIEDKLDKRRCPICKELYNDLYNVNCHLLICKRRQLLDQDSTSAS